MLVYSIILFVISAFLILTGAMIRGGKYELIYDFYLNWVNDLRGYCRELGTAMMCLSIPLILCGVLQLFRPELLFTVIGIVILIAGVIADYVVCLNIQKKYNGGMF